jgi:hypothetical protein
MSKSFNLNIKRKLILPILLLMFLSIIKANTLDQQEPDSQKLNNTEVKEQDVFDSIRGYRIRSETELRFLTEISDLTFLIFYYKPTSKQSQKIAKYLQKINDKIKDISAIIMVDCTVFTPETHFNCRDFHYVADSFPRIKLLIPPEKRYDPMTKEIEVHYEYPWIEKEMNEASIYNFIIDNIPSRSTKVTKENVYSFLSNDLFNKVLLFTDKAQPSLLWRGLTNQFFEKILFGEVFKNEGDIIKRFNVTKFPTLILYKVNDQNRLMDEPEIIKYEGLNKIDKLMEWLQPHALREKRYISQKRGVADTTAREMASRIDLRVIDKTNYEEYLKKYDDRNVIFYFNTKNNLKVSVKQTLIHNNGFFASAYFDCSKDKLFCLEKFNITKFPTLKVFHKKSNKFPTYEQRLENAHTFNISSSSNVTFEDQIMQLFPTNVKNVTNIEFPYELNQIKYENKNCFLHVYSNNEEEESLMAIHLLSQNETINKRFTFLSIRNPSSEVIKLANIPWKSGLFIIQKMLDDDYKVIPIYKQAFYSNLFTIADNLIYIKDNWQGRGNFQSEIVKQIATQADFRRECLELESCVLAFFDARPTTENIEIFNNHIEKLEKIKTTSSRYDHIKFHWVNATCHRNIANTFEIKDLPGVTFVYSFRRAFANFVGLWETFTINDFFERTLNNRQPTTDIDINNITFKNIICESLDSDYLVQEGQIGEQSEEEQKENFAEPQVETVKSQEQKIDL